VIMERKQLENAAKMFGIKTARKSSEKIMEELVAAVDILNSEVTIKISRVVDPVAVIEPEDIPPVADVKPKESIYRGKCPITGVRLY